MEALGLLKVSWTFIGCSCINYFYVQLNERSLYQQVSGVMANLSR